jgi:hypothetical protein
MTVLQRLAKNNITSLKDVTLFLNNLDTIILSIATEIYDCDKIIIVCDKTKQIIKIV